MLISLIRLEKNASLGFVIPRGRVGKWNCPLILFGRESVRLLFTKIDHCFIILMAWHCLLSICFNLSYYPGLVKRYCTVGGQIRIFLFSAFSSYMQSVILSDHNKYNFINYCLLFPLSSMYNMKLWEARKIKEVSNSFNLN